MIVLLVSHLTDKCIPYQRAIDINSIGNLNLIS